MADRMLTEQDLDHLFSMSCARQGHRFEIVMGHLVCLGCQVLCTDCPAYHWADNNPTERYSARRWARTVDGE